MKLTDLMVGDYIDVGETRSNMDGDYDVFFHARPITIEDFKFWAENDWDENDYDEFLAPIPLTTEILEKNGFVRLGKQYNIWMCRGFGFSLELVDGVFGYYEQGKPYHPTFITKYVHELQHALRLCGQNDLADNFKI